jgi:hypothetical protein
MLKTLLFILLITTSAFAGSFTVEWGCPKTPVDVFFNDQGKLQFNPDVFNGKLKSGNAEETKLCIADFQKKVQEGLEDYKSKKCQDNKDDLCVISSDYLNVKVLDKIQSSKGVKGFPDLNLNTPVTEIPDRPIVKPKEERSTPVTAEEFLKQKIQKKEIDPKNLSQSFDFKNKSYKVSDFDKVVGENIENVFEKLNREEAKQYAQNYMVAKADILKKTTPSDAKTSVLNNLNQMFGYIYGEKGAEELAKILECKPEDELKPIQDILTNLEDTKKVEKCKDLEPGEHKVFKKESSNYYGTGHYLLKRSKDGNYQAVVNVNFKTGGGSVSPQEMMERSKKCLEIASPHMKGPDGKTLQFSVLTPTEADKLPSNERPEPYDISIEPVGFGTNAASYAQNVDCATITHEMLHLLGLCDEYLEDRPQYGDMWNCRVVTKVPSVMRELSAFNDAVGKSLSCNCSSETCKAIMKGSDEALKKVYTMRSAYEVMDYKFRNSYCKETYITTASKNLAEGDKSLAILSDTSTGFEVESRFINQAYTAPYYKLLRSKIVCSCPAGDSSCLETKSQVVKAINNAGTKDLCPMGASLVSTGAAKSKPGVAVEGDTLLLTSTPKLPSLLQPQQFNKILAGPCSGKGADPYNECADFAYKNNRNGPCNVPAKCRDDKYFMGSQQ